MCINHIHIIITSKIIFHFSQTHPIYKKKNQKENKEKKNMKFSLLLYPMISLLILFQYSINGSNNNLISESCREASKNDPNLSYDFCVTSLNDEAASNSSKIRKPPTNLEDLVGMSIQLTKSNGTNIIFIISGLLKNNTTSSSDQYFKACLQDCSELYTDSISSLEDALVAFKSKDLDIAAINLSSALDNSVTCEDQFKDKEGETSPLTKENHVYFELNVISLAFIQMIRQP